MTEPLNATQQEALLGYGPMLDKVEEALSAYAPETVARSIKLQRDTADLYAGAPPRPDAEPVTQERVRETFGALYLNYIAFQVGGQMGAQNYASALQEMMHKLGLLSAAPGLSNPPSQNSPHRG